MKRLTKTLLSLLLAFTIMLAFMPTLPVYADDWNDGTLNTFSFTEGLPDGQGEGILYDTNTELQRYEFQKRVLDAMVNEEGIDNLGTKSDPQYDLDWDGIWDIDIVLWDSWAAAFRLNPYSEIHGKDITLSTNYFMEHGFDEYGEDVYFSANPKPFIDNGITSIVFDDIWYTGNPRKPGFEVREEKIFDGEPGEYTVLKKGKDYKVLAWYSNTDAGTGTLTIEGIGRYTGSMTREFTIKPRSLGSSLITWKLSYTNYTWNGKAKTPAVTGTMPGMTLEKGKNRHYTAAYKNNTNVGRASVVLTGHGNFTGTKTLYYNIKPKPTTIYSLAGDKGSFTVKWYKRTEKMSTSQITGYLIQYSKKSDFSTKTNVWVPLKSTSGAYNYSKKVTGLKSGTYYVRICTYKTINYSSGKKTFYSYWRPYKNTVKVK